MSTTAKEAPTYTFGRRDRGGLLIGFRGPSYFSSVSDWGLSFSAYYRPARRAA